MERLDRFVGKDLLVELQTLFTWIEEELPSTNSKDRQEPISGDRKEMQQDPLETSTI
jgi:hypothetical protein